jgi:hypothetical protein
MKAKEQAALRERARVFAKKMRDCQPCTGCLYRFAGSEIDRERRRAKKAKGEKR